MRKGTSEKAHKVNEKALEMVHLSVRASQIWGRVLLTQHHS